MNRFDKLATEIISAKEQWTHVKNPHSEEIERVWKSHEPKEVKKLFEKLTQEEKEEVLSRANIQDKIYNIKNKALEEKEKSLIHKITELCEKIIGYDKRFQNLQSEIPEAKETAEKIKVHYDELILLIEQIEPVDAEKVQEILKKFYNHYWLRVLGDQLKRSHDNLEEKLKHLFEHPILKHKVDLHYFNKVLEEDIKIPVKDKLDKDIFMEHVTDYNVRNYPQEYEPQNDEERYDGYLHYLHHEWEYLRDELNIEKNFFTHEDFEKVKNFVKIVTDQDLRLGESKVRVYILKNIGLKKTNPEPFEILNFYNADADIKDHKKNINKYFNIVGGKFHNLVKVFLEPTIAFKEFIQQVKKIRGVPLVRGPLTLPLRGSIKNLENLI